MLHVEAKHWLIISVNCVFVSGVIALMPSLTLLMSSHSRSQSSYSLPIDLVGLKYGRGARVTQRNAKDTPRLT